MMASLSKFPTNKKNVFTQTFWAEPAPGGTISQNAGASQLNMAPQQCPTGRVFQYRVGSGRVLEKIPGSGSGSGRVGVLKYKIGYFRVSFLLSGISGYSWVFSGISGYIRVFLGISGYFRVFLGIFWISCLFLKVEVFYDIYFLWVPKMIWILTK